MKLGYFTIGTQVLFLVMKLAGLADNVGWGFVLAPLFFHLGAMTCLILIHRQQRRAMEHLMSGMAQMAAEFERETQTGGVVDIEKARSAKEKGDDTIH